MWPAAEIGVYEGRFEAPGEGFYDVRISTNANAFSDTTLVVKQDAAKPPQRADGLAIQPLVARATGGVAVSSRDLSPLVAHIRALARPVSEGTIHPMRSAWWIVPFACALCAEWGIRRKRGLR